jgi:hypothetical protein
MQLLLSVTQLWTVSTSPHIVYRICGNTLTHRICAAGEMLTVLPGCWAAYHALTPVVMYEVSYVNIVDLNKLMWGLSHAYLDRGVTQRARECFGDWQVFLSPIVGDRIVDHVNAMSLNEVEFKWKAKDSASSTWKRREVAPMDMNMDGACGASWEIMASVCRNFMKSRIFRHRFVVSGVEEREWGRLLSFIQTCLGQTKYKEERDSLRGGRPSGRRDRRPMEDIPLREEEDVGIAPPSSMPPPPSRAPRSHPRVERIREEEGVGEVEEEEPTRRVTRSMSRSRSPQESSRGRSPSFRTGERRSPPSPSYSPTEDTSMGTRNTRGRSRLGPTATQETAETQEEEDQAAVQ